MSILIYIEGTSFIHSVRTKLEVIMYSSVFLYRWLWVMTRITRFLSVEIVTLRFTENYLGFIVFKQTCVFLEMLNSDISLPCTNQSSPWQYPQTNTIVIHWKEYSDLIAKSECTRSRKSRTSCSPLVHLNNSSDHKQVTELVLCCG